MKIVETATFIFSFVDINTKEEALKDMRGLLKDNDWLTEYGTKKEPLNSYYADKNGVCHIILAEDAVSDELIELTKELFESLKETASIKYIKTIFSKATEDIVYNNVDVYAEYQTIDVFEMKYGDEIMVYRK